MKIKQTKDSRNKDILLDQNKFQVMMEWEKPYMKALVNKLKPNGHVLEVGFGLGYSASYIQKYKIKSHTIIEANPTILNNLRLWAKKQKHKVNIVEGTWQNKLKNLGKFDCIFFDDSPHNEHPDNDNTRIYEFYHQLIKAHVNKKARLTWYCDTSIYWICHPSTLWSLDPFKIKIPTNCSYIPNKDTSTVYVPLLIFNKGVTQDLIPFVINNRNEMRINRT